MGAMKAFAMDVSFEMGYDGDINDHVLKTMACLGQYIKKPADLYDAIADLFCHVYTSDQADTMCREAVKAHELERLMRDAKDAEDDRPLVCSTKLTSIWTKARIWFANRRLTPIQLEGAETFNLLDDVEWDDAESRHAQDTQFAWARAEGVVS